MYPRALDQAECRQKFGRDACTPLDTLVARGYIASVPRDPLSVDRSGQATWTMLWVNRRFNYRDVAGNPQSVTLPGVVDVRSRANGIGLSGTPFNSW